MSTTKDVRSEDALDGWLSDLNGGERSMRKLRERLAAELPDHEDECPTCHGSGSGHTGNFLRAIS